jgi:endonuclease/exonuclease/phosphatase family metal-dependent hydrolase
MFIRCFAIVFIVSLFAGCSTTPDPPDEPLRLRVLSYNIHHGRGADGVINLQRIADVINRAEPDLVALQEVDVKTKRSGGVDQAATLGQLTGMSHFFAEAMPFQGGSYGEALLSNLPFNFSVATPLDAEEGQEPRVAAVIKLVKPEGQDRAIVFWGTHLCHLSEQTRLKQIEELTRRQGPAFFPNILAGDFNFTPGSEPYNLLIDKGWVDTAAAFGDPKPTIPADKPTQRIDYVFVRPANRWRVIDVQVLDEPIASDHAPVLVELEYILRK